MTRIVIVGEMFYSDLSVGGGPMPGRPPGIWGGPPLYPDQGLPPGSPGSPAHPWVPPGSAGSPSHPIYNPAYPDQGLPGVPPGFWGGVAPPYPDQGLPGAQPQGGTPVPPDVYPPPPVPEEIASQYIVSVYDPKTMQWTTKSYPPR